MKILIITHSLRYNYGCILQNFALQTVLSQLGHDVITLKLRRKQTFFIYIFSYLKYLCRRILGYNAYKPLSTNELNLICKHTDKFVHKYIKMSPRMYLINKKWVQNQKFDVIVVGSDQVLHPASYKNIENIYLDFINGVRKIIYAGSFGTEQWIYTRKQTYNCSNLIKDFIAVSSREKSGMYFFEDILNVKSELVLDPTLLLNQNIYISKTKKLKNNIGLVTYILDTNEMKSTIVDKISKELLLPICKSSNENMDNPYCTPNERIAHSVEDWLTSFKYADYIVTDSYHGTCFAIIFRKQFLVIANKKRGIDRFKTLLSYFSLEDRLINNLSEITEQLIKSEIDYSKIEYELNILRNKSYSFLEKALN